MMRNIFISLIKLILIYSFANAQTRYKDEIFSEVIKTEDVVYGNAPDIPLNGAPEFWAGDIDLTMDIYQADGDTLTNRPAIIFMHSGGFFTGSHEADDMVALSNSSAKMGYVAVSIAYRLNYNLFSTYSAERGIYRGLQDLSAAVRYLREHHSDYGIDYNNIFIWGSSAGAFSGIHLSYMEEEDRMASTFVNNWGWDPDLGCIDCSGNDFDHDRKPRAVIACWGGIFDLDWINEGDEIPVIMFHGVADSTVPFNEGYPFQNQFGLPWLYGSNLVYNKLDSLNIQSELHGPEGMDHEYWGTYAGDWVENGPNRNFPIIKEEAYSFLYDILYPFQMKIEGRWIIPVAENDPGNTMYEFLDGLRYTYYCSDENGCDSTYWNSLDTSDAIPNPHPYTFSNDTLTIDLFFGNTWQHPISFDCDGNVVTIGDTTVTWWSSWWRVGYDISECEEQVLALTNATKYPETFKLSQNYPNPFNPTTTIKYALPEAQNVQIMIYDIMGRKIRTLLNEYQEMGYRSIHWNAEDDYGRKVSAGMYIYAFQAGEFMQTRKMVLLK